MVEKMDRFKKLNSLLWSKILRDETRVESSHDFPSIKHLPGVIFTLDQNGVFTLSEGKGLAQLGLKPGQVVGQSASEIYRHFPWIVESINKVLQSGEDLQTAGVLNGKWYEVEWSPIRDDQGKMSGLAGVAIDTTSRRKEEEVRSQLLANESKLRVSLEAEMLIREEFLSILTHDLRTPLASAQVCAESLYSSETSDNFVKKMGLRIFNDCNRMNRMITNLLDGTRIKIGQQLEIKIEELDFSQLMIDAVESMTLLYGDRFSVSSPGPIYGHSSYDGIQRVIENLASNAAKHGDPIAPILVGLIPSEDHVQITVHNQGITIDKELQSKIFEPFHRGLNKQSKEKIKGWGLGLTLVKGVTESLGGQITLDSRPEIGTLFIVTIPRDSRR